VKKRGFSALGRYKGKFNPQVQFGKTLTIRELLGR